MGPAYSLNQGSFAEILENSNVNEAVLQQKFTSCTQKNSKTKESLEA
jgi:hypothetical protein